jgi:hypothetical protein
MPIVPTFNIAAGVDTYQDLVDSHNNNAQGIPTGAAVDTTGILEVTAPIGTQLTCQLPEPENRVVSGIGLSISGGSVLWAAGRYVLDCQTFDISAGSSVLPAMPPSGQGQWVTIFGTSLGTVSVSAGTPAPNPLPPAASGTVFGFVYLGGGAIFATQKTNRIEFAIEPNELIVQVGPQAVATQSVKIFQLPHMLRRVEWSIGHAFVENYLTGDATLVGDRFINLVDSATPAATFTVTLPANPPAGLLLEIWDVGGALSTYPVTLDGNGKNIRGAGTFLMNTDFACYRLYFDSGNNLWRLVF